MPVTDGMDAGLQAGIAIYNAGEYHAAHDAWEDRWLDLTRDTDDERFLHGLIQFTAAVHHAHGGNWTGLRGLAESAARYLADLPDDYHGVNVGEVRAYLSRLASDPEHVERVPAPPLTYEGRALLLSDLRFEAAAAAALVFAEERDRFEEETMARAVEYARADLDAGRATSEFVTFVMDFARDPANRDVIHRRLRQHVEKRDHRRTDVDGLFD